MNDLHNDHNVYILGAGFSRFAGLPLIYDFLNKMRDARDWLANENRSKEVSAIDKVLKFRLDVGSAAYRINLDLENIEDLFSLASATNNDLMKSIELAIAATLNYCMLLSDEKRIDYTIDEENTTSFFNPEKSCRNSMGIFQTNYTSSYFRHVMGILTGAFSKDVSFGSNSFITFNYDNYVETGLKELDIEPNFGLGNKKTSRNNPTVLKLHGSMNWYLEDKKIKIAESYEHLLILGKSPYLIPPTWNKAFTNNYLTIWNQAINELTNATRLIIIGFSAPRTDTHFKYLLAGGLTKNISLRDVFIINPFLNDKTDNEFHQIFNNTNIKRTKIHFIEEFFEHYIVQRSLNEINRGKDSHIKKVRLSS